MLSARHPLCLTGPSAALLQRSNVDSLDVGSYCDKLRLAIMQPRNVLQIACAGTHKTESLNFRLATKLYYDTLRIYKLQVDSLLKRSKMLVAHSNFHLKALLGSKRKLSVPSTTASAKKPRVTEIAKDFSITSYSELLEESEHLQHWSQWEMTVDEQCAKIPKSNSRVIQIREITIREVNTDIGQPESYDDSGFGNATREELNEFLQLFSDLSPSERKRKAADVSNVAEKLLCADSSIELPRLQEYNTCEWQAAEDIDINANLLSDEQLNMNINTVIMDLEKEKHLISKHNETEVPIPNLNSAIPDQSCIEEKPLYDINLPHMPSSLAVENMPSIAFRTEVKFAKSKLIVDKRTTLTEEEMRAQLNCSKTDWRLYKIEKRKRISARMLLSTLARNSKVARLPQKRILNKGSICLEYLSLLREIFEHNIDDELATEIYQNWQNSLVRKKRHRPPQQSAPFINYADKQYFEECFADNNNNNNNNTDKDINYKLKDTLPSTTAWNAYGVMMKLLDMWRYNAHDAVADEIDVKHIFPAEIVTRKEAAAGFNALLVLSSKNFIELTHAPHTIEIQKVKLGVASEQLIRQAHIS